MQNSCRYDAFGNLLESKEDIGNRILYTGQQYDQVTGQYYLRARYYNPVVGRFLQEDTCRGDGLNLYAYCANNPVMYYDPSGHTNECNGGNTEQNETPETLAERVDNGNAGETYYRAMSESDYDYLRMTGEVRATSETFTSPTKAYSSNYDGVRDKSGLVRKTYGDLPLVMEGWGENHAFFKAEKGQINIGLGKGKALEVFNSNIIGFKVVGGN